ncbi:MAG: permease prefix domain 1-containing protein [Treponema sp.]|nr:permease prefix domain 1-containing protein [Treponema sp.]
MESNMDTKEFMDSLFRSYEETKALVDFKEELLGNLNAKIENFIKKGMDAESAFAKASAELGDVSTLADELSLKKRKEVFEEVYMDIRRFMPPKRVAGYVVFGIVALFGITVALITFFSVRGIGNSLSGPVDMVSFFGAMMPFLTAAIAGFTFLGVTQETASMNPVSKKRGTWYAVSSGLIAFGLFTMPIVYFSTKTADAMALYEIFDYNFDYNLEALIPVISMMIPFILPGGGLLTYLIFTEKDRLKPWAKDFRNKAVKDEMAIWQDPATASRFGMFSGAIWVFAIGLFLLLGFIIGFKFSWLVFVFAVAFQLLIQGVMSKRTG